MPVTSVGGALFPAFPNLRSFLYNEISMDVLKVGSRGSALALRQTGIVVEAVERLNPGVQCRVEIIKTSGDRISEKPPAGIGSRYASHASGHLSRSIGVLGGKGLFVKEIEAALIAREIDLAVHSAKDLPVEMDERLCIAAFPERECPADALVSRLGGLMDLPRGARVGTSSLRRRAQILAARPDLEIVDLRGNLDTRLRKLDEGSCDAIVVAWAGLARLGLPGAGVSGSGVSGFERSGNPETPERPLIEPLPYEICLPAAGQGALAVQCRTGDPARDIAAKLDSPVTRACVTAERALLKALGGGCHVPIAALARQEGGKLRLDALVASTDGTSIVRKSAIGDLGSPEQLGEGLARELLDSPARQLLDAARLH
jgi:hydroxymethylbilane synthase